MTFCGVDIELPNGPAGILFSGGADSSLLLYILMKHSKSTIHAFTLTHKMKNYSNLQPAVDVLNWCRNNTGNNNIQHHITYADNHSESKLYEHAFVCLKNKTIDTLYIGDTCWPPEEINRSFGVEQTKTDRNPLVKRPTKFKNFILPFTNHNKRKVAEIYHSLELVNLFQLTRSCETLENLSESHCGKCWWCQERAWAFDLTDLN